MPMASTSEALRPGIRDHPHPDSHSFESAARAGRWEGFERELGIVIMQATLHPLALGPY